MKAKLFPILAAVAIAASVPGAALAGGDYYGGAVSGTAVPAPIPVPVYDPVWYFRLDAGVAFGSAPDISEEGIVFGERGYSHYGAPTFGSSDSWANSESEHYGTIGAGVGYRFSDQWRMDLTGDYIRGLDATISGSGSTGLRERNGDHVDGYLQAHFADHTQLEAGAFLVNAYYDMGHWSGWTPYVGGGLGFATTTITRRSAAREVAHVDGQGTMRLYNDAASSEESEHSLAAMATVGASYKLSDITELDLNYRYMYIGGVNTELDISDNVSKIEIDDTHDHQLRAGLRFNVN